MNRLSLSAVLALSFAVAGATSVANAQQTGDTAAQTQTQDHGGRHHRTRDPHKAAMHLSRKLGLSSDQSAKIEPILADSQQKMQALHADTSLTKQQRHEQMRSIRQSTHEQMASVLTPEQMEHLKAMHKEHRHHDGAAPAGA